MFKCAFDGALSLFSFYNRDGGRIWSSNSALILSTENGVALTVQDFFLREGNQVAALLPLFVQIKALKIPLFRLSVVFSLGYLYSLSFVSTKDGLRGIFL